MQLKITDVCSGECVGDASLLLVEVPSTNYWDGREEEWFDRFGEHGATDATGIASMALKIIILAPGIFPGIIPGVNPARDRVTGAMLTLA